MPSTPPEEFHSPEWHYEAQTPVVEGKYYDRATGEVRTTADGDHQTYMGPPAVDIIIRSIHIETTRASRSLPMETLLCHIMKLVEEKALKLDSIMATLYAIRVILAHDLTPQEFKEVAAAMALRT